MARNLDALEILGKVRKIEIGNAKKYYLAKSIPSSSLFDISSDLTIIIDSNHIVQYINNSAQKFLEKNNIPIIGERLENLSLDFFSTPDVLKGLTTFSLDKIFRQEFEYQRDGQIRWYSFQIMGISIKNGNHYIALVAEDITSKKQIEVALFENEQKYRSIFDAEADALIIYETNSGKITDVNFAAVSTYGYEYDEFLNQNYYSLFVKKEDLHVSYSHVTRYQSHKRKNGKNFPVEIKNSTFSLNNIQYDLAAVRDVTLRKKLEDEIREKENFVNNIIDSVDYEICILDQNGIIISVNQPWKDFALSNPPADDFFYVGWNYLEVCERATGEDYEDAISFAHGIRSVMRGDTEKYCQEYQCESHQKILFFNAKVSRLNQGPEYPLRILITHEDITTRKVSELNLKESEKKFKEVLDSSTDTVYRRNIHNDVYDYISPSIFSVLGYSADEFINFPIEFAYHCLHPDDRNRIANTVDSSMASKKGTYELEYRFKHKDGHYVWLEDVYTVVCDDIDSLYRVGRVRDISEKKKTQEDLSNAKENATFLAELLEISSLPFAISYPDGKMGYCNTAFLDLLGYTREEMEQLNAITDLNEPGWKSEYNILANTILETGNPQIIEKKYRHKNGTSIPVELNLHVKKKTDNSIDFFYGFVKDISDRKKAEEEEIITKRHLEELIAERTKHLEIEINSRILIEKELFENEIRFKKIFDYSPNAIVVFDVDNNHFIDANPAALRLYDCSREELLNSDPRSYIYQMTSPTSDEPSFDENKIRVLQGEDIIFERAIKDKRGLIKHCMIQLVKIPIPNQTLILAILVDITPRKKLEEEFLKANEYNRRLFEADMDSLVFIGHQGKITDVNTATEIITGYSRHELIGTSFCSYFTDPKKAQVGYLQALKESQLRDYPLEIKNKIGYITPVLYNATVIRDTIGKITGVLATARDISKTKVTEEAIRKLNVYNRSLIEANIDPMISIGPDGYITDVNSSSEFITGLSRFELIGSDFSSFFTHPEKARRGYQIAFENLKIRDFPLEIRHKNGKSTPILFNASVYRNEKGDIVGILAAARDISDKNRIQEALRESEARFMSAFDNAPIGMALVSQNGQILKVNQTLCKILGYSKDELLLMQYQHITHPDDLNNDFRCIEAMIKGEIDSFQFKKRYYHKNGHLIWAELSISHVKDSKGNINYFIAQVQEITKKKGTDSTIASSHFELEILEGNNLDNFLSK
ncbi:PAS domain S-box protein [Methanospirillum hungatei]|nr:PAS domain S-box protein [Methanospirillum hungatei]